jgi:hypothetical protein
LEVLNMVLSAYIEIKKKKYCFWLLYVVLISSVLLMTLTGCPLVTGEDEGEGEGEGTIEGENEGEGEGVVEGENEGEGEGASEGEDEQVWPGVANAWSWDGSWSPQEGTLPPAGFYDDTYFDGHMVGNDASPLLPPGAWDWISDQGGVSPLAQWRTFEDRVGTFALLADEDGDPFGWRLFPNEPSAVVLDFRVELLEGSSGVEVLDLGAGGLLFQTGKIWLGDGPDMIRFGESQAADWHTGSSTHGSMADNDLVIGGGPVGLAAGEYNVLQSTVHTGPGRDLVFMNNIERAGVDLGNGEHGRTDSLDPDDGDDMVVIGGNCYDFRIFCGEGNDVIIWRVDETLQNTPWIGPNFFGGGGWAPAVWDEGTDRIVLDVPLDTELQEAVTGVVPAGMVGLHMAPDYDPEPVPDGPTENNLFARYYGRAGIGPEGQKTLRLIYNSASEHVVSGDCGISGIEELQIGIGPGARVYRIDEVNGGGVEDPGLAPITEVPSRADYLQLFDTFGTSTR